MEKKKKTKTAKFLENVGLGISFIWMLVFFLPILIYEEIDELFKKKRKSMEPKPDTIKFVCSECGETFTAENKEEELQVHGNDGEEHTYLKPMKCLKCHGTRTRPENGDISLYEKIWEMDELRTFIWDMEQDWLQTGTTVDHGLIEYRCTECGTVFEARDIGHRSWQNSFRSPKPFPSRCPNCHQMKTLPIDEKNSKIYEPLWAMLELAEQTKEARERKKLLEKVAFVF